MNTLALDLATKTGWALRSNGALTSGTIHFKTDRFSGGGMRYLKFGQWLRQILDLGQVQVVYFEEVRRHLSTDAAHVHGGLLAMMTAELELRKIPYQGLPVGSIKKTATGKGNADKAAMVAAARARWPEQDIVDDNCADALWILETATGEDWLS